jgi:hypothetical protein
MSQCLDVACLIVTHFGKDKDYLCVASIHGVSLIYIAFFNTE